ncbi:hypothetical protein Tco_1151238, partial [Tanacetum coccineum]
SSPNLFKLSLVASKLIGTKESICFISLSNSSLTSVAQSTLLLLQSFVLEEHPNVFAQPPLLFVQNPILLLLQG